ncbi:hypothetical protein SteCoe_10984 [Stentor coeruleus]|uniref:Uncharacterized protein n=1 Tax=Stentor coeruleus TaxID=5963 RepID=A0A1R2CEC3_9CILI|nr:hypothetical protein SteCoe_10984 [Stentor coeruleus]
MSFTRRKTMRYVMERTEYTLEDSRYSASSTINLKDKVLEMNRTLYKDTMNLDKIEQLEKQTIRGECADKPQSKTIQKPQKKLDLLTLILKSEHKTSLEGTQILKLPKLPFGKHSSYNDEPAFKDRHFLEGNTSQITPEKAKELEDITRKFRLNEKKYKASKRNRLHSARPMFTDYAFYDVYDMCAGKLICAREEKLIECYEKDKASYKEIAKRDLASAGKEKNEGIFEKVYVKKKILDTKKEQELISRLLPNKEIKDSALSQFYSTKYSSLFEGSDTTPGIEMRRSSL